MKFITLLALALAAACASCTTYQESAFADYGHPSEAYLFARTPPRGGH